MDVNLSLKFKHIKAKEIYNSMLPDFSSRGRSEAKMSLKDNTIEFDINSNDLTSVRATINSIILRLRAIDQVDKLDI